VTALLVLARQKRTDDIPTSRRLQRNLGEAEKQPLLKPDLGPNRLHASRNRRRL